MPIRRAAIGLVALVIILAGYRALTSPSGNTPTQDETAGAPPPSGGDRHITAPAPAQGDESAGAPHHKQPAPAGKSRPGSGKITQPVRELMIAVERSGLGAQDFMLSATGYNSPLMRVNEAGMVHAYITVDQISDEALSALENHGVRIELSNDTLSMIQSWIPIDRLRPIAELPFVVKIGLPEYATPGRGSRLTEGDAILLANELRALGFTGQGARVGVISDGANDYPAAQATGDLPGDVTVYGACQRRAANPSQCLSRLTCNEGTAIMEIIHDIAPDARLAAASGLTSLEFITHIDELVNDFGADIIIDDLSYYGEPYFADGPIAEAVRAVADDVLYLSSAGNGALAHYEAEYLPGSFVIAGESTERHDFGAADGFATDGGLDVRMRAGGYFVAILQWNDRFGASANDYDLYLSDDAGANLDASMLPQDGTQDPIEFICYHNASADTTTVSLGIERFAGVNRRLELFLLGPGIVLQYNDSQGSIFGHAGLENVVAVGAINASEPDNDDIAPYSSQGPARVDYPLQQERPKPDVVAIDGVSVTGTGGFPSRFFGTSAAAPHAAAIGALLHEIDPAASPADLRRALQNGSRDLGEAGFDSIYGYGLVNALNAARALAPGFNVDTDADGVIDIFDAFPQDPDETLDTDNDGTGNNADTDDDNDGIPDAADPFPLTFGSGNKAFQYLMTTSTSSNVTRLHLVNTGSREQVLFGTLYNRHGERLGNPDTALTEAPIKPAGRLVLSAPALESIFGVEPWTGPALLEVRGIDAFELMSKLQSPSGLISNTNCVRDRRVLNIEGFDSENTTYIRFINTADEPIGEVRGTLYDRSGAIIGNGNTLLLNELQPRQAVWITRNGFRDMVGAEWRQEAMLELSAANTGLKLLNLNFINAETFFNFSCFENSDSGRVYLQTTSTSANISQTHIVNTSDASQRFLGTLFSGDGARQGPARRPLAAEPIPPKGRIVLTSRDLEEIFGVEPWVGPAVLEVSGSFEFELMTKLTSPSGLTSNTNCVRQHQVHNIEGFDSSDFTYVRFINTGADTLGGIRGSLYDGNGDLIGAADQLLVDSLPGKAAAWLNRDNLSAIVNDTWQGEATLAVASAPDALRLLNLNFVNDGTFFNFSCYEAGQ